MKKLFSFVAAVLFAVSASAAVDVLTAEVLGAQRSGYADFSGKKATSDAVYAGNCMKNSTNDIQLRYTANNDPSKVKLSGIVTTTSGGKLTAVKIAWGTWENDVQDRTLEIYGSNTAYTDYTDLFDAEKQGTLLGSFNTKTNATSFTVEGDYTYIGIRSKSGALYLQHITIAWDGSELPGGDPEPEPTPEPEEMGLVTVAKFLEAKDDFNIYTLCGTVSDIVMDKNDPTQYNVYGNFNLTDSTGTIYIYGLLTAEGEAKKFREMDIHEGDVITLKGSYAEYKGAPQIQNATFVSKSSGETALEAVRSEEPAEKRVVNGQLVIIRNGVMYNAAGTRME